MKISNYGLTDKASICSVISKIQSLSCVGQSRASAIRLSGSNPAKKNKVNLLISLPHRHADTAECGLSIEICMEEDTIEYAKEDASFAVPWASLDCCYKRFTEKQRQLIAGAIKIQPSIFAELISSVDFSQGTGNKEESASNEESSADVSSLETQQPKSSAFNPLISFESSLKPNFEPKSASKRQVYTVFEFSVYEPCKQDGLFCILLDSFPSVVFSFGPAPEDSGKMLMTAYSFY